MKQLALSLIAALIAASIAAPAPAAGPALTRTFTVTGFDRVRIDGPFRVTLATNVAPYARAHGDAAAIDSVSIDVQGRTLIVRPAVSSWGGYPGERYGPVEIMIGTHDLSSAWINGSGLLAVDKIKGLKFDLSVQGAGSASVADAAVDQMSITMSGSGTVKIAGTVPKLSAILSGTSVLDGTALKVKDAVIDADGASTVRAIVTGTAKIGTRGVGTVDLAGSPACEVKSAGSAVVNGCR